MSCEQNHRLDTLARMAGVAKTELDGAWATATISLRQARAIRPARAASAGQLPAAEPALADPDPTLVQRVWGESSHGEPTDAARRALIAALRMVEHYRKGIPARLAALRHLLGEPGAPPSPVWRAIVLGTLPPDLDLARLTPWDAAELLIAGCTHPDLVARVAEEAQATARALIARPELAEHDTVVEALQTDGAATTRALIRCPELRQHPDLIHAIAGDAWWAQAALIACPGWDPPHLWKQARAEHPEAWRAAWAIVADPAAAPAEAWAAVAEHPPAAAYVLARVPAARHRAEVVEAIVVVPAMAGWAVVADPTLLEIPAIHATITSTPKTAAWVLIHGPALRQHPDLIRCAATDARWAAWVVIECPELRARADLLARIAGDARWAAKVVIACPDLRTHPDLLARIAGDARWAAEVVIACPDLRAHPDLIRCVADDPTARWAAEVVDRVGWHPTLWRGMTDADRRRWAAQHGRDVAELDARAARWPNLTAADRAVLAGLPVIVPLPEEGAG